MSKHHNFVALAYVWFAVVLLIGTVAGLLYMAFR